MDNIITLILYIILVILVGICLKKILKQNNKQKHKINIILLCLIFGLIVFLSYNFKENKKSTRKYKINKLSSQKAGFVNFRKQDKNNKDKLPKLLNECGLPRNYSATSHCFADSTHQTCCILGPKAREYANKSGNPIGKASELAFNQKYSKEPKGTELTSWCTCFGSKVCSAYAKKFNDGTHIKFVNNPNSKTDIRSQVHHDCEGYFRDKFNIRKHGTPGINNNFSGSKKHKGEICENTKHSILKNL